MKYTNTRKFTKRDCTKGGSAIRGGEFADEARERALRDARGMVLREGKFFTSQHPEGLTWQKRRSISRNNSIEMVYDGKVRVSCGETQLRNELRWAKGE